MAALLRSCPLPARFTVLPGGEEAGLGGWGTGQWPVWLPTYVPAPVPGAPPYEGSFYISTPYGWGMKWLWVMAGDATEPVTISGTRVGGGPPLLFQSSPEATPSPTMVLDPAHPGIPVQHGDFREFPSAVYFTATGCYELTAAWASGRWSVRIPFVTPPDAPPEARRPTPNVTRPTPSGTPSAAADCPYPTGVEIPGAKGYFVPWGVGAPPVWVAGLGNPPPGLAPGYGASPVPTVAAIAPDPSWPYKPGYGWFFKELWVIAGTSSGPVTVRGANVSGGPPPGFEFGTAEIVQQAILDPAHPEIPVQHGDFREFPSYLFFPATGCYELSAEWAGGRWSVRIPFIAPDHIAPRATPGQVPPTPTPAPQSVADVLASCHYSQAAVIPGAEQADFAPWGLGQAPVWLAQWGKIPPELRARFPGPDIAYVGPGFRATPDGWVISALWVVQSGWSSRIVVSGARQSDGAPLRFNDGTSAGNTTTTLVLDPSRPGYPATHAGRFWEWLGAIYFPTTGCYDLEVRWAGGAWTATIPFVAPPEVAAAAGPATSPAA